MMEKDLWTQCQGSTHIISIKETAWRIVEAQHLLATRKLVDSAHEQEILEEMIDTAKPTLSKTLSTYHPLLFTPFRYPPRPYGSRFGSCSEPSLWYGSLKLSGAMAEKAFYQLAFLQASTTDFGLVEVTLTAFATEIKSSKSIDLSKAPFAKHNHLISSRTEYHVSQALGSAMRTADIESFLYQSARDPEPSLNIALFTPKAFAKKHPEHHSFQTWHCSTDTHAVEFKRMNAITNEYKHFSIEIFRVNNVFPRLVK